MNNKFNNSVKIKGIFNKLKSVDKRTLMRTFFWLVAALTILANMVTIILIFRKSHLNRVRLFIIANMCVADIILPSGMCMGLLQVLLRNDVKNNLYINTIRTAIMTAHLSSLLTVSLSAGDRFMAVKFSWEYNSKMTKSMLLIVLFMIWLLSITIAVLHWVNVATLAIINATR